MQCLVSHGRRTAELNGLNSACSGVILSLLRIAAAECDEF